tara:strand:+ start:316 stop:450 length:135 start_codon:yes stop_codon:yes gene_type:complete
MARVKIYTYVKPARRKRPGVHAKTKSSTLKGSKNYLKKYKGQGR